MNPCIDILAHGEKIFVAGDVLQEEKLNVHEADELIPKEKVMLAKELEEEKLRKKERDEKKALEESKTHWDHVSEDVVPEEQQELPKEVRKKVSCFDCDQYKLLMEQDKLEREFLQVNEHLEKLKSSSLGNVFEEKEAKTPEEQLKLEDVIKPLSKESAKRVDDFFIFLREIHNMILKPKRQEMKELQEVISVVTSEIEEMEKKNLELEKEIELMRKA